MRLFSVSAMGSYVVVLAAAFATTFLTTPFLRRMSFRVGAVVPPDERKIHDRPLPTLGGAAMLLGLLVGLGIAWRLDEFREVFAASSAPLGIAVSAVVIYAVGQLDDLRKVGL